MKKLKTHTITDFSGVLLAVEEMESVVDEVVSLISYVNSNINALKNLLNNFAYHFKNCDNKILKEFFHNNLKKRDDPLRILIEHNGIIRCFYQLYFLKKIIDEELEKICKAYEVEDESNYNLLSEDVVASFPRGTWSNG